MTTPLPDPAAPRDAVGELHAAVRKWTEHIPQNLPYVDLMFAFGCATLGDRPRAAALVESARKVLQVPIPAVSSSRADLAVIAAVVSNFLFKAFAYRVDQALAGQLHVGPLSDGLLDELEEIAERARSRPTENPFKLADHIIARMRVHSSILEPTERVDPYAEWTKSTDPLKKELSDLHDIREPGKLADRIRTLHRDGPQGRTTKEVQFLVLHEALPLALRVGEAFTVELLQMVPAAISASAVPAAQETANWPRKQGELLNRALFFAGYFDRGDIVKRLTDEFYDLIHAKPADDRFKIINYVAGQCLRSLQKLGMRDEIDRFLTLLQDEVLGGQTTEQLRKKHAPKPETWSAVLQTLLNLASGWLNYGLNERAAPILKEACHELLGTTAGRLPANEYTELARTYVRALGHGLSEDGLLRLIELFRKMPPDRITNTWTTAQYYSRFHLNLVEDVVFAVCRPATEPHVVTA
jgi:hypothetical protein